MCSLLLGRICTEFVSNSEVQETLDQHTMVLYPHTPVRSEFGQNVCRWFVYATTSWFDSTTSSNLRLWESPRNIRIHYRRLSNSPKSKKRDFAMYLGRIVAAITSAHFVSVKFRLWGPSRRIIALLLPRQRILEEIRKFCENIQSIHLYWYEFSLRLLLKQ